MPAIAQASGTGIIGLTYTATGSEGTDVTITIGKTMFSTSYTVVASFGGGVSGFDGRLAANVRTIDLPTSSRTTTTFRMLLGGALTAGDIINFIIVGTFA